MTAPQTRTEVAIKPERIKLPWSQWLESEPAHKQCEERAAEAAALCAMRMLHLQASAHNPPIDVFWDPTENSTVVITTELVEAFALKLAPCIPKAMKLRNESTHPERIQIRVEAREGATHEFFIHPEWQGPEDEKVQGAHAVACEHRAWKWTGAETMHPHWAIRRMTREKLAAKMPGGKFNLEQTVKVYSIVTVGNMGGDEGGTSPTNTFRVELPILTNPEPLGGGVELFWEAASVAKKDTSVVKNWKDDEKLKQGKRKNEEIKEKAKKQKTATQGLEV
jgi:hypothetical protein